MADVASERFLSVVILSEVSIAKEVEGPRTASRKRSRYWFFAYEALASIVILNEVCEVKDLAPSRSA